ncbi:toll-like receptor 9 [Centruroides vittatus]|uniref:toll-like receptor 9 n=1 Tax=Centruroides vittatus TaxID=120091 RepID=UPI003510A2E0
MKLFILFVFFCVVYPILAWLHRCPPPENVPRECSCTKQDHVLVSCRHVNDTHMLSESLISFQNYVVDKLEISDSGPLEMLGGPFAKLNIHHIVFNNVRFGHLPILRSFKGIEDSLDSLTFNSCKVDRWTWTEGQMFSYLKTLIFMETNLPEVLSPEYFAKFPNKIENLNINKCNVKELKEKALDRFAALKSLKIENNKLNSINRASLPRKLRRLIHLSFIGNPLKVLPEDIFTHMPRLENLMLGGTKLKTLDKKTFEPIWDQLEKVFFNNIQLNCDCNSTWLIEVNAEKMVVPPTCSSNRKPITEFTHEELCRTRHK